MSIDWNDVQWYTRTRSATDSGPNVSVSKAGRLTLNEEAMRLFGSEQEALQVGVILGGRGKATLVLQAAQKSDAGALAVSKAGRKFGVNTAKFFRTKGLEKIFGSSYSKPEYEEEHNALIVNL